ncbi:hypothetical protein H0H87_006951 [Tephrocybe sp. NHM501043]|nr:hypothetical protein H0H87_006951 [Tephrocybe sp. NHM501043]
MFKFLLSFSLSLCALANTDIVNFHVSEASNYATPFAKNWPIMNDTSWECINMVTPAPLGTPMEEVCTPSDNAAPHPACPHEIWLALDLTRSWVKYSTFTLRISSSASTPTDFSIQIFDPKSLSTHFGLPVPSTTLQESHSPPLVPKTSRLRYARIRLVDVGVPTPPPASHPAPTEPTPPAQVVFIVALEPIYLGFLPPSVVPVLGYIACACLLAWIIVPKIIGCIEGIAVEARKELHANVKQD